MAFRLARSGCRSAGSAPGVSSLLLYVVSDDNRACGQRTLLLLFRTRFGALSDGGQMELREKRLGGRQADLLLRRGLFFFVLLMSVWMVFHSQVSGDQYRLLEPGWVLLSEGVLRPYGSPMSGGGMEPGAVTSLVVGLPLLVWHDYRAVSLLILLTHLLAYFLLDRLLRETVSSRERLLFALFYWASAWRLYFSAFLWNPNYLFLLGAVHAWTAYQQRERARFLPTLLHVLALGVAFQLHGSFLILVIASAFLVLRRYIKVHIPAAVLAGAVVLASLIPWIRLVMANPDLLPAQDGFFGRGLILGYPIYRGVVYWLRYASLHVSEAMAQFDFTPVLGAQLDRVLAPVVGALVKVGPVTLLVPLLANVWLWRRKRSGGLRAFPEDGSRRSWLHGYVRWCFLAAVATFALSPTTIMSWQALIVFHAAVLPLVLWLGALLRGRGRSRVVLRSWAVCGGILALSICLASPPYRRGGRKPFQLGRVGVPEIVRELGIQEYATYHSLAPDGSGRVDSGSGESEDL